MKEKLQCFFNMLNKSHTYALKEMNSYFFAAAFADET